VATTALSARSQRFALLRDAALARPTARGWIVGAVQVGLIVLSHGTTVIVSENALATVHEPASQFWYQVGLGFGDTNSFGKPPLSPSALAGVLLGSMIMALVQGVVAWLPFRIPTWRQRLPMALFIRSWWRTCAWGALVVPVGCILVAALPSLPMLTYATWCLLIVYAALGPMFFARLETRQPRRGLPQWRPECPECGYSLRKLRGDRCPECGVAFPTNSRVFRRWAVQRLVWERVHRGNFAVAYLKTALTIIIRPLRAARGTVIQDRSGRAIRWATTHVVLLAIAAVGGGVLLHWLRLYVNPYAWWMQRSGQIPTGRALLICSLQSLLAWLVALAVIPLIAVCLSVAVPARHPAATRSMIKWSLYCTVVAALGFAACCAHTVGRWLLLEWFVPGLRGNMWLLYTPVFPPIVLMALTYGLWWAIGVSANPYLRRRGLAAFAAYFALYVLAWLALASLLFPPGAIRELL
jgi:hypothetical protein